MKSKMDPLVSVVIPVYNVESYLHECVKSVVEQTYTNIEIILVDDGSTDNSGTLCDEFALSDSRICVFHKKNGGLSDARNYGIRRSRGSLISFIDSDDYVSSDYIMHLYQALVRGKRTLQPLPFAFSMMGNFLNRISIIRQSFMCMMRVMPLKICFI